MTVNDLVNDLYSSTPTAPLYHYTSLTTLESIISGGCLYATDMRYFNDSAELRQTAELLRIRICQAIEEGTGDPEVLKQFRAWTAERIGGGHMQFVASFTENGNLLSQWRSYCNHGQGISLGFKADDIAFAAYSVGYKVGKCIYDPAKQSAIASKIVAAVHALALARGPDRGPSKRNPSQNYYGVFEEIEDALLQVAALLKHSAFREEDEWRVVSPIEVNYVIPAIKYRVGHTMLIPYMEFPLPLESSSRPAIEHVYLGPTAEINNSMSSLSTYLSKAKASPRLGITYCQIPYRGR